MKDKILFAPLFIALLVATNPTKDQYVSWIKEQTQNQSEDPLVKLIVPIFGGVYFAFSPFEKYPQKYPQCELVGALAAWVLLTRLQNGDPNE